MGFAKNPEAMRGWLQTQAIAEHYNTKLSNGDAPVQDRIKSLEHDPELAPVLEDIKKNGLEAVMKYYQDEELMAKFSQKMGGLPQELCEYLLRVGTSVTQANSQGQTPLAVATQNRQADTIAVLKAHGAQA